MKFELKKITHNEQLSKETNAFAADVYIDGIKAGSASNNGHGGSTIVHLHLLSLEKRKAVNEWIDKQPPKKYGTTLILPVSIDSIVDDLLEDHLNKKFSEKLQKQKIRWCKNDVCFRLKGDAVGTYRTIKKLPKGYTKQIKQFLVTKCGDKIEEILNETIGELPV